MKRWAGPIIWAIAGLLLVCVTAPPLISKLSTDLLQLQVRERFLDGGRTLPAVARDFEVPLQRMQSRLGLNDLSRDQLATLTLAQLAARRRISEGELKRRIVEIAFRTSRHEDVPGYLWRVFPWHRHGSDAR